MRRIVRYNPQTHYADIKISPQWHQWLRQVRGDPPSLQEQAADVQRQENTKVLAAEADERWNKKESLISKPAEKRQRLGSGGIEEQRVTEDEVEHVRQGGSVEGARKERSLENPWAKKGGGPSEGWQPETWTPGVAPRR
jgi:NADH dehydrogenase [ubiquinone] 1 alpha subcomplex assembly factor 2